MEVSKSCILLSMRQEIRLLADVEQAGAHVEQRQDEAKQ